MRKKILFLMVLMLTSALTIMAQITTSSMAGKVTFEDVKGEEVIGATVVAVHEPSGTRYTAVTNTSGNFTIQGMRTGGPYEVTVSYIGYQPKVVKGVTLELAETYNLNVWLSEDANVLTEVVVSGKASKFAAEKTGASTNINNQMIANMPTVTRNLTDVTRLSPYGGNGMSFAGSDGRTANFTVDGANFNNDFGLSSNLPGGGNPISLDAIEEMQVVISPFDVRQTNFIGGGVNAITKSGTNTFKGSAYIYHRNENMRGDAIDNKEITGSREKDQTTTYGFTLGGPIIKNKLFFFVNGEMENTPTIVNRWRASEDGSYDAENYLSRTTISDMQRVSEFVSKAPYNYNTGSYNSFPSDTKNRKFLVRLDWNITDKHHLALRYNYTKNKYYQSPNASSMDGGTRSAYSRMSMFSMAFANSMYSMENIVHSFSVDLNSRLTDKISNQFLLTYSKKDDVRGSDSSEFPFIDILDGSGNTASYMSLGYELFTYNNAVHNTVWNVKDDVTFYLGKHKLMAGISYEHQMADNQYMRNGTGYYRYLSLEDFLTGATPEVVCLTYGYDGESSPAARVRYNKLGIYVQDDWTVNDKLKLTMGLRVDGLYFNNSDLMTNKAIYDLDYDGRHIDTGTWPSAGYTFSPRVGFTYDVFGDKSLKIRGGTGLFVGRQSLVFFTNMPTNSGMVQYQAQIGPSTKYDNLPDAVKAKYASVSDILAQFNKANGGMITNLEALKQKFFDMGFPYTISPEEGAKPSSISAVDPNYKLPQAWKSSIAVDYQIPVSFPFTVTLEGIYTKMVNDVCISDWSLRNVEGFARWNGADNRPMYPAENFRSGTKAFMLENTSKGYQWSANITLNAQPFEWLSLMAAYTHTVKKELTSLPGSNAESAFTYVPTIAGPNNIKLHNGKNVTPDRIVASATAHDKSGNHYSLIYEAWRGGSNESYMLANDMNGDGYNYDALYIPTDLQVANNEFRFVSEDDKTRFMEYVHNNDYLKDRQDEYAEAYSVYSPWVHRIDFSYKHDFKLNIGKTKHTLQLSFDMKNVMNFFNSSWGVSKYMNTDITEGRILKYDHTDAQGYPVFSTPKAVNGNTQTWVKSHSIGQCWYASVGVRYIFN